MFAALVDFFYCEFINDKSTAMHINLSLYSPTQFKA